MTSFPAKQIHRTWWKESSVYQVYPASFKDTTGNGVGDIPGIISELDYLDKLGVDIVWLSPILRSPQVDMGYDVSDYYDIHPPYGTMGDVERLIEGLHGRGMKYVMDLVVNHTSDQHEWFRESKKSLDNRYRNYYIWRKPRYDADGNRQPPNNWVSFFGGPAWEYDAATDEYYLCLYAKEQPDLNWENPDVRGEVHRIIRFWLDKGVDGFRMDVINFVSKDQRFLDAPEPDNPTNPRGSIYYACGPRLHEFLKVIGSILKEYDAFSVGEMPCCYDQKEILKAVQYDRQELNMVFQFEIVDIDHGPGGKFTPKHWRLGELKQIVSKWQTFMCTNDGWNALYLENHDQGRSISRLATDKLELRTIAGKMLATFLAFQSGTPFIYQGQELAQVNIESHWGIEKFLDIQTINYWRELKEKYGGDELRQKEALEQIRLKARDNGRTPMQWNDSPHAGFTSPTATPWMSVHDDYREWNASRALADPNSVFIYWSQVLRLRKAYKDIFVYGDYALVDDKNESVFAYTRTFDDKMKAIVVCNFSENTVDWFISPEMKEFFEKGRRLVGNYASTALLDTQLIVRPFESLVFIQD